MDEYCSNKVLFAGAQNAAAVEYFAAMGYDAPPFYNLIVEEDVVYFESRYIPPLRDLNEIAELFDVSYDLVYQLPGERSKEKYHYACLKDESLGKAANGLRLRLLGLSDPASLETMEISIDQQRDQNTINAHEHSILKQLLGKQYRANDPGRGSHRSR